MSSPDFQRLEVSSEEVSDGECEESIPEHEEVTNIPKDQELLSKLHLSGYNWFEFCEKLEEDGDGERFLDDFFVRLPELQELSQQSLNLVVQSHRAFNAARTDLYEENRVARYLNGEVVSETDSSDLEDDALVLEKNAVVQKKQLSIRRRVQRLKTKAIVEKRFLSRRRSHKTSRIIKECPNIGEVIEQYVQDHNVGANAWRRY